MFDTQQYNQHMSCGDRAVAMVHSPPLYSSDPPPSYQSDEDSIQDTVGDSPIEDEYTCPGTKNQRKRKKMPHHGVYFLLCALMIMASIGFVVLVIMLY